METNEQWFASVSRQDWSLERRGARDDARHNEKVKEAIQDNLENVISDGSIITADPYSKQVIKVPMRSLELPKFRYGDGSEGIGSGDGSEQPGDVVGQTPGKQAGTGKSAGDQPGVEYYEAEFTVEEIQQMVFSDLGLPYVKPKEKQEVSSERIIFDDIRKKRSPSNLDIGRTVMQNMMRNAQETGKAEIKNISTDDYRVRMWQEELRPENSAVVIAMADISGSMGDFEKYITRAFCWWTTSFLRSKHPAVELVFVAHDTNASEVTEEQFFSRGTGGGTRCSSANQLALELINNRYSPSRYNVYPLHFSDGDNWSGDNEACISLVQQLLENDINQYAYVQIGKQGESKLLADYKKNITDERFKGLMINSKEGVLSALKTVFKPDERAA
jgi:sporulation protein YhbH